MMKSVKQSGTEFLEAVRPKMVDGNKTYPDKKTVFNALFATRGTNVSVNDIPRIPQLDAVAHLNGRKSEMLIRSYEMSPESYRNLEPTNGHYMEVALSAYLHAGGNLKTFRQELDDYKEDFELQHQNFNVIQLQQERAAKSNSFSA